EGNGIFYYKKIDAGNQELKAVIKAVLPEYFKVVAAGVTYRQYINKFETLGGIAEEFIDGEHKESPSVQCRINPIGNTDIISTHDQVLGGESGQVFLGATFPANNEYNADIVVMA